MSLSDLELVRIAKRISDISELGLLLKFEATEVDTFEEENEKDVMVKKGTKSMLKQWNKRKDSTKEKLVEALRLCDMENLAQEVERGILTEQHKIFMQQDEQPSNTVTTVQTSDPFDGILRTVAKNVVKNSDIDILGIQMGFTPEDIHRYIVMNSSGYGIAYDGTLQMLRDWRQHKQTRSTERSALKTALLASRFIHLADDLFGEEITQVKPADIPPQGASAAGVKVPISPASDAVPNGKLTILAKHVPHGKYSELSEKLGIEYNPARAILSKHSNDSFLAMRECLGIWKDETGGSSAKLKEILRNAGIGGTLIQYIE